MIKKYNRLSFYFGVPGLVLQTLAVVGQSDDPMRIRIGFYSLVIGVILLGTGLGFYARSKGRAFAWGLLGLMGWVGLLALVVLVKERAPQET